jgi:RimJ/RimL family protein N-acetyltransferase
MNIVIIFFHIDYRRVIVEVDIRNIIMRKFLERCGFALESIMRKYRIVNRRNRDVAVYVVFNSDWEQVSIYANIYKREFLYVMNTYIFV